MPAAPDDAPAAAPRWRWVALPAAAYDADDKLGLGARAEAFLPDATLDPYRAAYVIHVFASTNGFHHHRVRFDLLGLGAKRDLRLTGRFAFRAWLHDGYWGLGNGTLVDTEADTAEEGRYRYSLIQPFGHLTLRKDTGRLALYTVLNVRWSQVDTYPGSFLSEDLPYGMDGGLAVQVGAGAQWDTRDQEVAPTRGWLFEAGARGVTGASTFGGPMASVKAWAPAGHRVVLAGRLMGEWLFGEVPFYEMVHWGGAAPVAGIGGAETARGIPFGRWRGPGKAVANVEVRTDVLTHRALKEELRWQIVPFVDAVSVWGAGDDADAPPPELPLHPAAGLGIHVIWAETMVGRLDMGVGQELTEEGPVPNFGAYLVFDQTY